MTTETTQMLCTTHRHLNPSYARKHKMMKAGHPLHPCTTWIRGNAANYEWLYQLLNELLREYRERWGEGGNAFQRSRDLLSALALNPVDRYGPYECEPDRWYLGMSQNPECYSDDVVEAYRRFYIATKSRFATWKYRDAPEWYTRGLKQFLKHRDIKRVNVIDGS